MPDALIDVCNSFQPIEDATYVQARDCNEDDDILCNIYVVLNDLQPLSSTKLKNIVDFLSYNNTLLAPQVFSMLSAFNQTNGCEFMLYQYGFSMYKGENDELQYDLKIMLKCLI